MRTGARGSLAVLVVAALLLGGCGADGPAPQAWATAVCRALAPWRTEIGTLAERTQQQMNTKTTPAQAKENLVRLFGGAESASETARAGVAKAGVPSVDHGDEVASGFVTSLGAMRDAYGRAKAGIEALATDPAETFYSQVGGVVTTLNEEYDRSTLDTTALDSVELKRAFDEVPECR